MSDLRYEIMKHDGWCRSCDKPLKRNVDYAIKMYSRRNRGQHILLCPLCVEDAYGMIVDAAWREDLKPGIPEEEK